MCILSRCAFLVAVVIAVASFGGNSVWRVQGFLGSDEAGEDIQKLDKAEVDDLIQFVLGEVRKLKIEHRELEDCHGLEVASVLRGRKQVDKGVKFSLTMKVQPTTIATPECVAQQNSTSTISLQPEICEAEVVENESSGKRERTLLRSACLQVEELQG